MRPKVVEDLELVPVAGTHTGASWLNQSDSENLQKCNECLSYSMSVWLLKSDSLRCVTFHQSSETPFPGRYVCAVPQVSWQRTDKHQ